MQIYMEKLNYANKIMLKELFSQHNFDMVV